MKTLKVSDEELTVIVLALKDYAHRWTLPMNDKWSDHSKGIFALAERLEKK